MHGAMLIIMRSAHCDAADATRVTFMPRRRGARPARVDGLSEPMSIHHSIQATAARGTSRKPTLRVISYTRGTPFCGRAPAARGA